MEYLPIFVNLNQQPVLVIGGGIVAARKVELLIRAGAKITVISKKLCSFLIELLSQNKIIWLNTSFQKKHVKNILLIIAATNNNKLNKKISEISKKKLILVNVVDDKPKCSFIFPSILDRSPLLIAISSNGLSPILTRIIKEKLEIFFPQKISKVVEIAGKWRLKIKKYFKNLKERRFFWENLFDGIFINQVISGNLKKAEKTIRKQIQTSKKIKGELILVGSGPGNPELLTIRALQVLQKADVILYDNLVSKDILNLVRKDSRFIFVGKKAGKKLTSQEEINLLILKLVKENNRVIRLKGGDPFIFGRGAEEVEFAWKKNIPFQVVPGITAAIGISAYSGIPLTHRNYSSSILFLTGKYCNEITDSYLRNIVNTRQTIVIYMGLLQIKKIQFRFLSCGFDPNFPVSIINKGTEKKQKVLVGTLKNLHKLAIQSYSPSMIMMGKVINLHHKLCWFQKK